MPESAEVTRAVERGYVRVADMPELLSVTRQRCDQLTRTTGFPNPKVVGGRRMWKGTAVERWAEAHWWGTKPWRVHSPHVI